MKYLNTATRVTSGTKELIYMLIDFSPSMEMEDYEPSRVAGAIEANRRLIEAKAASFPDDEIGIIVFSGEATCLHPPAAAGRGGDRLCRSLQQDVELSGGTDFTAPLELAHELLLGSRPARESRGWLARAIGDLFLEASDTNMPTSRPPAGTSPSVNGDLTKRIIMLTDGEHNGDGDPVKVASQLKKAGVIIECIGIAGSRDEVDEAMLRRIASRDEAGKPRYCFIGDTSRLIRKYKSMANQIRPV